MPRGPLIAGNWKMHKTIPESIQFLDALFPILKSGDEKHVYLAVPFTALAATSQHAASKSVSIGAQTMHYETQGAYTGEISSKMLLDAGASFTLIGHSERRQFFGCTNKDVNMTAKKALSEGLTPIICIGESLQQREAGDTEAFLETQIQEGLKGFSSNEIEKLVLAYEPIWAIGTGQTATPDLAEKTHKHCRAILAKYWSPSTAEAVPILYGGSVKPDNIASLLKQPNIDGALIGGASLDPKLFIEIIQISRKTYS